MELGVRSKKLESNSQTKRLQVSRACFKCRKMHAGCGIERPCKRCIQSGTEDLCVDIPRRKRLVKKLKIKHENIEGDKFEDGSELEKALGSPLKSSSSQTDSDKFDFSGSIHSSKNITVNSVGNQISPFLEKVDSFGPIELKFSDMVYKDDGTLWEQTFNELYASPPIISPLGNEMTSLSRIEIESQSDFSRDSIVVQSPIQQRLCLTKFGEQLPNMISKIICSSEDPINEQEIIISDNLDICNDRSLIEGKSDATDLNSLLHQIEELKESKHQLENRLMSLSKELEETKKLNFHQQLQLRQPEQQSEQLERQELKEQYQQRCMGWHSIGALQSELAISVWKANPFESIPTTGVGGNVLIECNHKFIEMMGYSIDILRNHFTCGKLICKVEVDDGKDWNHWPRRAQITTAHGVKEALITITPIKDPHHAPKYFVVQLLEVLPSSNSSN